MTDSSCAMGDMKPGARAIVRRLLGGQGFMSRLAALGITIGAEVVMLQNCRRGPVIVLVRETRVALGRGESTRVVVQPVAERR